MIYEGGSKLPDQMRIGAMKILRRLWIAIIFAAAFPCLGGNEYPEAPYIPARPLWDRFTVFVWQYKTSIRKDRSLYDAAGFRGYDIDRGAGKEAIARYAADNGLLYYVDHVADKGYLHVSERTGRNELLRKREVLKRPWSLADPATRQVLKEHIWKNIAAMKDGPVVAYSLDDEPSVGVLNAPCEVDGAEASVAGYRAWLRDKYGTIERLNAVWGTRLHDFGEAQPVSFEEIRLSNRKPPLSEWNLSRWMDWRSYMDSQFADTLADLTGYANALDPATPAGITGGQQPAPYGGYDYGKICASVQWMEAYDIGGTCEILRSLWAWPNRRPYMQTWFSTGDEKRDRWFLWYYLLHGNRGVIAWPDDKNGSWFRHNGDQLAPYISANAATLREIQGDVSRFILDPGTRFDADAIAVVYSHTAVQAGWAMDASVHGRTWPNRSSSMDNANQTAGKNRVAWFKLLEDCGFQYNVVTDEQVAEGILLKDKYRVVVLPRTITLSIRHARAIEAFVRSGGTVIADYLAGVLDENGVGQPDGGALDRLFGIERDENRGYFDGKTVAEIDAELYQKPFVERLRYEGALEWDGLVIAERGLTARSMPAETQAAKAAARIGSADVVVKRAVGKGRFVYLNLTPVAYSDMTIRQGPIGRQWRELATALLDEAGMRPRVKVLQKTGAGSGEPVPMAEVVIWRKGEEAVLGVIDNPTRQGSISSAGEVYGVNGETLNVEIRLNRPVSGIQNLRTGEMLPDGAVIPARWIPSEALLFRVHWPSKTVAAGP